MPLRHRSPRPARGSVDEIRAAIAAAVAESSPRIVARQVGMSADGISRFIHGSNPTPPLLRKLLAWHARHPPAEEPPPVAPPPAPPPEEEWEGPRVILRFEPDDAGG